MIITATRNEQVITNMELKPGQCQILSIGLPLEGGKIDGKLCGA